MLLHVSIHLHYLQWVLNLCFATVTTLLKLQLNKIGRLKCSRDRCWMIKYNLYNVNCYITCGNCLLGGCMHSPDSLMVVMPMLVFPVWRYEDKWSVLPLSTCRHKYVDLHTSACIKIKFMHHFVIKLYLNAISYKAKLQMCLGLILICFPAHFSRKWHVHDSARVNMHFSFWHVGLWVHSGLRKS